MLDCLGCGGLCKAKEVIDINVHFASGSGKGQML